ncbi:ABC transporter ATP-binding protein [Legionella lytica]|uniref:ABC transporter ATP-binding protein n=1 Tax=Legionella lytica TaxID=96232 RepID=A0ABY4Y6Y6_9GAMM|nr:ABC transporter ATP-binding protein [Legionella lytica]USQ13377.1 ABC transporter ATP-binding protein [Legionella lytica]
MDENNLIIDVKNLGKNFEHRPAVVNVSLQVRPGEIYGFLGPNGSGKTTTIRMLCGLLTPDHGSGTCLGYDILTQSKTIRRHVGYIPQHFSLYKQLTVYENVLFMAELYGVFNRKRATQQIMAHLGLSSRKDQLAGGLSGGWKQRLALACALIHQPFLLLLDEPTASVDAESRMDFWEIMRDLSSEGMTILLSSHNMDEIERCHRISYISEGNLLLSGKINEIIRDINLTTWKVQGKNLLLLAKQLEVLPEIEQVITLLDTLHISGKNKEALNKAIQPFLANPNFTWQMIQPSLDDVFVWMTKHQVGKS